jgi:hypothetical protein
LEDVDDQGLLPGVTAVNERRTGSSFGASRRQRDISTLGVHVVAFDE